MELWVPGSSSCEQTSSSKIDAFSSVVAVTGRPLPLRRSVDPVSLIFLIKLWTAMREHSKLGCSFQILYVLQPFSMRLFSMRAYCLSVLLRSSELGNCETSERRPVTSTDFDFYCNSFLHCQDFFTRQRGKKTNWSREVLSAETKLFHFLLRQFLRAFYFTWQIQISIKTGKVVI